MGTEEFGQLDSLNPGVSRCASPDRGRRPSRGNAAAGRRKPIDELPGYRAVRAGDAGALANEPQATYPRQEAADPPG